jgi:hypothetical protein
MKSENGLKQKIKMGEISPDEAIASVEKDAAASDNFLRWANGPGRKRYAQALRNKEALEAEAKATKKTAKKKSEK